MRFDADLCYRAVASRDVRFDGRFFTGVTTTGVYCRPICPARTPRPDHCRFFACAAAAEAAGFRPCLRCRPESAPGTPAWRGTSATVARALRLITEGALDKGSVADLADRLGIGSRHLRRLFADHLGASPLAIALTRRLHFARMLIGQTRLSMAHVALSAGFGSIRRFNAAVGRAYGLAPSALRRSLSADQRIESSGALTLRLAYRPPFDWAAMMAYLTPRAIPGVERITPRAYRRAAACGQAAGVIDVRPSACGDHLLLRVPSDLTDDLCTLVCRVRELFDLDAELDDINVRLREDPVLSPAVRKRPGLRVPGAFDRFELSVRAILGQQVSVAAATEMAGRIASAYGRALGRRHPGQVRRLFPGPDLLRDAELESIGLTRRRAGAVRALAAAVDDRRVSLDGVARLEDATSQLQALPGIGPWTTGYIAMRALRDPDAFPADDLGLRRALAPAGRYLPRAAVEARAECWRPWRAYAAMHLWMKKSAQKPSASRRTGARGG
jgi:AraC family transcriptional regulator of adaptative response / DNA-3-methyladenine glycosylase II